MATDPNGGPATAEGRLTYTLGGPDKDSFEIEDSSGQITVGADTELDYESNKKTYMVTVTATDPSQAMTTIDVTINVDRRQRTPGVHQRGRLHRGFPRKRHEGYRGLQRAGPGEATASLLFQSE